MYTTKKERFFLSKKANNYQGMLNSDTLDECQIQKMLKAEISDKARIFYRCIMGLLPAQLSIFLSKSLIGFVSTAAGFLAPPFIIIFPALMYIKIYKTGQCSREISKCSYICAWIFQIVLGVGSYFSVIANVIVGSEGGF